MPSSKGYKDLESGSSGGLNALLNEALGVFFISFALFGAGGAPFGALSLGGVLAFMTWFEGDGQYNPAVTVSGMFGKDPSISLRSGLLTILAQVGGAAIAVIVNSLVGGASFSGAGGGDLSAGLVDAFAVLVLLFTYAKDGSGLGRGLSYFSALSAFPSKSGANASIVLGAALGNAALGGGLDLSTGILVGAAAPLVTALIFAFFAGPLTSILGDGISNELFGTFFFSLMYFAIAGAGAAEASLALGTTLFTLAVAWRGATCNPAVTIAKLVASGRFDTWFDPLRDVLVQTVAVVLAVVLGSFAGVSPSVPAPSAIGAPLALEALFTAVLVLLYLAGKGGDLAVGLGYFACVSTYASSFNPALSLGMFVASFAGFGSTAFALTSTVGPLVGGVLAAVAHGKTSADSNEAIGAAVLLLTVGSGSGNLALGAMVAALSHIFSGATINPAVTVGQNGFSSTALTSIGYQVGGSIVGGLVAVWAGVADGAATSGSLPASPVAELLLAALLVKVYGVDSTDNGLAYYALLAVFGSTAGSIANPATSLGYWVASGALGGGFDFGVDSLVALALHVGAPLAGAVAVQPVFKALNLDVHDGYLGKIGLSAKEFFGSFVVVTSASGIGASGAAPPELALSMAVLAVYLIYGQSDADLFPAVSAYRAFGTGTDAVGFLKRVAAQSLGAMVGGLVAGALFGSSAGAGEVGSVWSGVMWGVMLAWAYEFMTKNNLGFALALFTAMAMFGYHNSAAGLGLGLADGLVGRTGFGFVTDTAWLANFASTIFGGALGGRLLGLFGK